MSQTRDKFVDILATCKWCDRNYWFVVTKHEWDSWHAGASVQTAFPDLSADDRELLISNTCGNCWDSMFGGFDD